MYPDFGQLIDRIKSLLGIDQFRTFIDHYLNKHPGHNQLIKEELSKLEKEVLILETEEQKQFLNLNLPVPTFE